MSSEGIRDTVTEKQCQPQSELVARFLLELRNSHRVSKSEQPLQIRLYQQTSERVEKRLQFHVVFDAIFEYAVA